MQVFYCILTSNIYHRNDKSNQLKRFTFKTWEVGEVGQVEEKGTIFHTSCTLRNKV